MRIISAIDSFKGSITSEEANKIIQEALPQHDVQPFPIADGGEGTVSVYMQLVGGERVVEQMTSINNTPMNGTWGWEEATKTAVIEAAEGAGILYAKKDTFHPKNHTSYGVGEQIRQALGKGAETIIIGLGGTGTTDGGVGMLQALGCRFYDMAGAELPILPIQLNKIANIDMSQLDSRLEQTKIIIASDVTNPLCGMAGCVYVFGPQKGLQVTELLKWDQDMKRYENIVNKVVGKEMGLTPGAGAAGGLGFALLSFFNSHLESGFELLAKRGNLSELIASSDLVITGEGKFDSQSLHGKVTTGISKLAQVYHVPTLLFVGKVEGDQTAYPDENIHAILPIVDQPMSLEKAIEHGPTLLRRAVERAFLLIDMANK